MKRWALLTILLYLLTLLFFSTPLILSLTGGDWEFLRIFGLVFLPILVGLQAGVLLVPVAVAEGRPVGQRRVVTAAIIGALPIGLLAVLVYYGLVLLVFGEQGAEAYLTEWLVLAILLLFWCGWGVLFQRAFVRENPQTLIDTMGRWLLRGSILELLVVVPGHIVARHRHECCAPPITLLGIAMGLGVALLAFGPVVFALLVARVKQKRGG